MPIEIREADLQGDRAAIVGAVSHYLTQFADPERRYDWLYRENPHGQVRVWIAVDENREVVGTAAAFPRRLYFGQEEKTGWVFGDFCVSDRHRSLGPAVALQRALLQAVDSSGVPLSYDFPSTAMTAVYKRLKIESVAQMIRMAKLLRINRKVRERLRNESLANAISSVGNIFLGGTGSRPIVDPSIGISLLESRCGPEFDALVYRMAGTFGICVQRSSQYLNWRYLDNPYKKHELMTAERDGALLGFAVISQTGVDGELVDFFGEDNPLILGRLITAVVELFRRRGIMTVSAELIASHPWIELFKKAGFYPRESKPFVVYASPDTLSPLFDNGTLKQQSWFITGGDRDS